jgi:hypothetical protein
MKETLFDKEIEKNIDDAYFYEQSKWKKRPCATCSRVLFFRPTENNCAECRVKIRFSKGIQLNSTTPHFDSLNEGNYYYGL